jgi:hypothetical protein
MTEHKKPRFEHSKFQPSEVELITGLAPVLIRDWRRRDLIHKSMDKGAEGFDLGAVTEFLLLKRLSDHGIGPKRVYGWSTSLADHILRHALRATSAWPSPEDLRVYLEHEDQRPLWDREPDLFGIIRPVPHGISTIKDIKEIGALGDVVTIIDLVKLSEELLEKAGKPIAKVNWIISQEVEGELHV